LVSFPSPTHVEKKQHHNIHIEKKNLKEKRKEKRNEKRKKLERGKRGKQKNYLKLGWQLKKKLKKDFLPLLHKKKGGGEILILNKTR